MAALRQLMQVDLSEDELAELGWRGPAPAVRLAGWLSSCVHGEGRSAADRQFYYINSRPCDPARISKVVNEVSQCSGSRKFLLRIPIRKIRMMHVQTQIRLLVYDVPVPELTFSIE